MTFSVALAVGLLAWSLVGNLLAGDALYVTRNLLLGVLVVVLARRSGATWGTLGLDTDTVRAGARWGGAAAVVVILAVVLGSLLADHLPGVGLLLGDDRADLPPLLVAWHAVWRIPLGTALFEEVVFRGVLLGLLVQQMSPLRAMVASSVVFGLWHVAPTIVTLRINEVAAASGDGIATIAGAVLVTTLAGAAFCILRLGSGSVLAPVLAHWAANAAGLVAAAVTRTGG